MRAATITATLIALTAPLGCSDGAGGAAEPPAGGEATTTTPASSAEPRTEAAVRTAATEEFDSYAAGDYGAAWDLWSAAGKKAVSRTNYLRLHRLCPPMTGGIRFEIQKVTMDSDRSAHVRVSRLIAVFTYRFVYEAGRWRFVPDADSMRDYRTKTVEQMAAERRAQGGCGK